MKSPERPPDGVVDGVVQEQQRDRVWRRGIGSKRRSRVARNTRYS
jgi:hypothetical protein